MTVVILVEQVFDHLFDHCFRGGIAYIFCDFVQPGNDTHDITIDCRYRNAECDGSNSAGGVAANSIIRADLQRACDAHGYKLYVPPLSLCGDNGAMIGCQGYYEYLQGKRAGTDLNAYATLDISED